MTSSKVQPAKGKFTDCLAPLTDGWMKLFGIHLNSNSNGIWHLILTAHQYACLIVVLAVEALLWWYIYFDHDPTTLGYTSESEGQTSAYGWNLLLDYVNSTTRTIGSLLAVIFSMKSNWNELIDSVDHTERRLSLWWPRNHVERKFRKLAFFGITYLVLALGCMSSSAGLELESVDALPMRNFVEISAIAAFVYPMSALVIFSILCSIVTDQFRTIGERLKQIPDGDISQFQELQSLYANTCYSVEQINRCFGVILLFEMPYITIGFLNSIAWLTLYKGNVDWEMCLLILSILSCLIIHVCLITLCSDKVKRQANGVKAILCHLVYKKPLLMSEINAFLDQSSHLKPQITADGYFVIDKRIFPTLIGTSLTYFLIMFQFHKEEQTKV